MALSALSFVLIPRTLLGLYINDPAVISFGVGLLMIAACFQMFDGLQVIATGILRGAGDTHTPMVVNLFAYWNSDRMVLSMYGAHEVDARSAPELVSLVATLAGRVSVAVGRVGWSAYSS